MQEEIRLKYLPPAINKTEKPIAAIRMIDIWPETFIIFLNVKKYSELKEKTIKHNQKYYK